jgi:hypothetical protein
MYHIKHKVDNFILSIFSSEILPNSKFVLIARVSKAISVFDIQLCSFATVSIREYKQTLGDNPFFTKGVSMGLNCYF